MNLDFKLAMEKLAVVGQENVKLRDCSEVIPLPVTEKPRPAHFPAGTSIEDLEIVVGVERSVTRVPELI